MENLNDIFVGYDVGDCDAEIYMNLRTHPHGAIVGGSGSGKSVAVLCLLFEFLTLDAPVELYLADPKASGDFRGIVPPERYGEGMQDSAALIHQFYNVFLNTPEACPVFKLLVIDEYAGLITSLPDIIGGKEGKAEVERLKAEMASLFMLSRSRGMGVWLVMQRPSAALFSSSSGALDNLMFSLNLGKLQTQTHISLFANETLENQEFAAKYNPGPGYGYFRMDGKPLRAIRIPYIRNKDLLIRSLQRRGREGFNFSCKT